VEDMRPGPADDGVAEKEILLEGLGRPLQDLRHRAGNPTHAVIAEGTGVSARTLDNVLNGRHLISSKNVVAIAEYLGGEPAEWTKRWADTSTRLKTVQGDLDPAQSSPAADDLDVPDPAPPEDPTPSPWRRGSLLMAGALTVTAALVCLLILALHSGPPAAGSSTPPITSDAAAANARQEPVAGRPEYRQCSTADRSILSQPGRDRAGEPRGTLRPGELFVVTAKTRYWKYGQVVGDPNRTGWVMSANLCAVPGRTPGS
jgi:lambda repressor-like predicted transcriptional regulator